MAAADPAFVVTWPRLAAPAPGKEDRVLERGATLPSDVPASTVQALVSVGAIRLAATGGPGSGGRGGGEGGDGRPTKAAKAPEWQAYAVAQGVDPAVAKSATKAQLVALYLTERDERFRAWVDTRIAPDEGIERPLAIFDALESWTRTHSPAAAPSSTPTPNCSPSPSIPPTR